MLFVLLTPRGEDDIEWECAKTERVCARFDEQAGGDRPIFRACADSSSGLWQSTPLSNVFGMFVVKDR